VAERTVEAAQHNPGILAPRLGQHEREARLLEPADIVAAAEALAQPVRGRGRRIERQRLPTSGLILQRYQGYGEWHPGAFRPPELSLVHFLDETSGVGSGLGIAHGAIGD